MKEEVLVINNLWKKYDMGNAGELVVLKDINLTVNKGDFVAIAGASGSGKSTLMNMIGALDVPSWGKVILKGKDISKISTGELAKLRSQSIGFIFQKFNLVPTLSALGNVTLPAEFIGIDSSHSKKVGKQILTMLDLGNRMDHTPGELSGGQQQRVAIARSLINDPEIILADEPTGNLDSKTGESVMDFLEEMNKNGKTIILITHDLNLLHYASKIIYLKDGKIEKQETRNKKNKREEKII